MNAIEETFAILRGLRERYELHHGVRITDRALMAAATLAHRYLTDGFPPDQAIDLLDEAAGTLPRALKEAVDEDAVAEVVSRWTGIPVSQMREGTASAPWVEPTDCLGHS